MMATIHCPKTCMCGPQVWLVASPMRKLVQGDPLLFARKVDNPTMMDQEITLVKETI